MANTADLALKNLERLIAKDPMLRDILNPTLPGPNSKHRYTPDVDVFETDSGWTVLIELPGVPRDRVKVRLEGTQLVVSGSKPSLAPEGAVRKVSERGGGPFKRTFLLPFEVAGAEISAKLDAGVLSVHLPRTGTRGVREVEIG